jgi:multiple sugar transport system permease protein
MMSPSSGQSSTAALPTRQGVKQRSLWSRLGDDKFLKYWLLAPAIFFLLALTIFPYIYAIRLSLYAFRFGAITSFIGLTNYENMLSDAPFWGSLLRTLIFSVLVVLIELILGLILALFANRITRFRTIIRTGLMVPMSMAPVVVAIIWRLMLNQEFGILNYVLDNILHLGRPNWLGELAFPSMVILDVWQWTPFMFLILLAGLQSIPLELYDAAYVDGASEMKMLRYVTLPLLSSSILVALVVRTVDALRIFDQVFLLTQGGPGTTTEFVSLFIYKTAFKFSQMGYASALLLVLFAVTIVLAFIYVRAMKRSAEAQG